MVLLETFTTKTGSGLELPDFLDIVGEVTDDQEYSMFLLSDVSHDTNLLPAANKMEDEVIAASCSTGQNAASSDSH